MDKKKLEESKLKVSGVDFTKEKMEEFFAVSNLETLKNKFFNKTQLI